MQGDHETKAQLSPKPGAAGRGGGKDSGKRIILLKIFAPAIVFTVIMFGTLAWFAWYSYRHLMVVETQHFKATELVGRITHLDEVLTMSARMAAATGDPQWERRYGEFEPQLDAAIKEVADVAPEALMSKAAAQTDAANVRLVEMEREAFGLVREGDRQAAMATLHSAEYAEQKRIYSEGMKDFTEGLQRHTRAELRRHRRQVLIAASFVAVSASLVLFVWVGMLQKLKYGLERRSSAKALRRSEAHFKDFFANTAIGFYRTSPDGRILAANPALIRMLGYSSFEELAQRNLDKEGYEPQYSRSEFKERIEKEGRVVGLESAWAKRDGTTLFIIENSRAIRDEHGNTLYYEGTAEDITERRKIGETLRRSEERFRSLVETTSDWVWQVDQNGVYTYCSPKVKDLLGYEPEEIVGKTPFDLMSSDEAERVGEVFRNAMASQKSFERLENMNLHKDGRVVVLETSGVPIFDADGCLVGYHGIDRDITERKKAEEEVKKFKTIAEKAGYGNAISDLEGNLLYANESFAEIHGCGVDELIGKKLSILHTKEQMERVNRLNERLEREGSYVGEEVWHKRKDGTTFPTLMNGTLIRDDNGSPLFMAATAIDITKRKQAESALGESEEKYRTLVESAGETIVTIARDGKYLFMNKTGAERAGRKAEDYIGRTMWDMFPKHIADRQMNLVRKVIDSGEGVNMTVQAKLQGQLCWYNTTIEPLSDSSGAVTSALIVARDIHEIRQAEMELEAYGEKMTRAERLASLGILSATLAHELTQPLTVIGLSIADSLAELEGITCPPSVTEGLRDSLSEVSNATAIVERFRSFARKSSGKVVEKVELSVVAERIVKLLKKSAQQARIAVHLKGMDKLPVVYLNEKEVEQLFFALIQNAIHAADGTKPRNLVIEGAVKSEYTELRFSDDCGGIDGADVDKVFEPFFTTKPAGEGTGLGLCIVERVAERSGGRVRVENRPGEGVTFVVTLGISKDGML